MSIVNPEFRRNVWLELTPARLGVSMLGVVAILALVGSRSSSSAELNEAAEFVFALVVFFWGGQLAAEAVVQEIVERTWDSQRMSALGPWSMSWGKLFGAPICAWAAALPALAAMIHAASDPWSGLRQAATYVLLGVLCHAVSLALSLQSIRKGRQPGRVKTLFFQLAGLGVVLPFAYLLVWRERWLDGAGLYWFSLGLSVESFALLSALLFAAWAVLGVYRQMRLELQKPTAPTAWLAFLAFLVLYQTGLIFGGMRGLDRAIQDLTDFSVIGAEPVTVALLAAGILLQTLVYVAIFTEPKSMIGLRQAWDAFARGDWRGIWLRMPRWALTLKLTAIAVILILAFVRLPQTVSAADADLFRLAIASFLFLLRNVGIVLLCNFWSPSGRGDMAALIVLSVLVLIAPAIFAGAPEAVAALFLPPIGAGWAATLVPIGAQLVLVGGLLARVWIKSERARRTQA